MTREEAKEIIELTVEVKTIPRMAKLYEALAVAIEALKKQIPKKPTDVDDEYGIFTCVECGTAICYLDDKETHKYCLSCGQAIDWSEE